MQSIASEARVAEASVAARATGPATVERSSAFAPAIEYGRGGVSVHGGGSGRGARAPRAPFVIARLLPHLLVLSIVGAVVLGGGFWDPALRVGVTHRQTVDPPDLSVPLAPLPPVTTEPEPNPGLGYFTRSPIAVTATRLRITIYETRGGETLAEVAKRFGLQPPTLLWANSMQDPDRRLPAGTKLRIPPVDGMLHQVQGNDTLESIAAKYQVQPAAIISYRPNNVDGPNDLLPNSLILVVGGTIPRREKVEVYTVNNGDTIWSIAARYGLEASTLVWANNLTDANVLAIGQTLVIPPVNGIIHRAEPGETIEQLAQRYGVKPEAIVAFAPNGLGGGSPLLPGQDVMIPGGTPPPPPPPPAPVVAAPATTTAPAQPTAMPGVRATGSFIWPATGAITTYFGDNWAYYGPGGHNGIDIANSLGTPLAAADGGVVIFAGWHGGLGNAVAIDHENGFVTWYGHASAIYVSPGMRVERGQTIAAMGSTGNSTGSHIHFIIVRNGAYVDPLAYLPR